MSQSPLEIPSDITNEEFGLNILDMSFCEIASSYKLTEEF